MTGRTVAAAALCAAAVAALGAPLGLLWSAVAPDVPVRVTEQGATYADPQPEQLAAADGWFALLGLPFGVLAAVVVWVTARRYRGVVVLAGLAVGGVAAGLLAWWLGRQVGLAGYRAALDQAGVGTDLARPADLAVAEIGWWPPRVAGVPLVPGLSAAVTYTLLAAWCRFPGLRPGPPGWWTGAAGWPAGPPPRLDRC